MANFTFKAPDIKTGINNAFASVNVNIADVGINAAHTALFKSKNEHYDVDDATAMSKLGTNIISNLHFGKMNQDGSYNPSENNYIGIDSVAPQPFVPVRIDAVLMSVNKQKRIVKTSLQGRNGTVKEYIGADDYAITVSGIISKSDHLYPEQAVRDLVKICNIPDQVFVSSKFLDIYKISYVVIESFKFAEQRGVSNQQAFEITMISDTPPEQDS